MLPKWHAMLTVVITNQRAAVARARKRETINLVAVAARNQAAARNVLRINREVALTAVMRTAIALLERTLTAAVKRTANALL